MGEFFAVLAAKLVIALIESDSTSALARHLFDLIRTFFTK
jgi:hypothetical protein